MTIPIILTVAMILLPQSYVNIKEFTEAKEDKNLIEFEDLEKIRKEKLEKNIEEIVEKRKQEVKEADRDFEALVQATFRLESGNGTSSLWLTHNNPGGIKCGSRYCRYASQEEGLQALRTLLKRYVNRFGYDFEAIRSVYSESDDTELFRQIYYEERGK